MNELSYTASPKVGFPHYKGFIFKRPYGWEDRGEMESFEKDREWYYPIHDLCKGVAHIGIEEFKTFRFCPKCLVKLDSK